jgi:MoaA/NifB/PqqE/SkfB family radical SAM enzyme
MATYLRVHEEIDCIAPEFPGLGLSFDENLEEQEFGPTPAKTQFHETPFGHTTCMAGKNGFVVDDDGTVYGCMVAMQMKVGAVGSILEKSAEDIWRDSRWGIFRDPLNNGCRANMLHHSKNSGKELKLVELQRRG